ncbi:dual specificity protein phosphatase CDC14C isoform X3 [Selaginella moellendorffii]|uniref:dual specificity protein phosphatase CDC14C isoform X3 n=1 Tax=Selaginella moellendorffii TaxID=88036 RepID=UPI000D1D028A|nr:dual specificity protein phosphatase CDC14C isoform X3 [Selaginella moellendorffii]|eukprot:XP_024530219.1 dual specificity protein phosphatase CDC14C isoform X3 [Selaginella moellendorffii]
MVYKEQQHDRSGVCEVIKGKVYFAALQRPDDLKGSWLPRPALCFSVDNELDFGPLNMACTYRFCWKLHGLLQDARAHGRCVCFCTSIETKTKSNAAVLLGAYLVLFESWEPDAAYSPLALFEPYFPFRDPTCGISTYHLTVLDCIQAVAKGKKVGWIDFSTFNLEEYEYFEQVENGDLNWIVPNKLVAFSGPAPRRSQVYPSLLFPECCQVVRWQMYGYRSLVPEDYIEYFKRVGVVAVVRLNKRLYDRRRFTDHGINHYDLYFPDGSCPPERIVQRFMEIVEETAGAIAVHCKAGLGRTGVLIGCYIMKHFRFTCNEVLGYLRLTRPGSVIGPQQHFLRDMQARMWKAGDGLRRHRSDGSSRSKTSSGSSPLVTLWNNASAWSQGKGSLFPTKTSPTSPALKRVTTESIETTSSGGRQLVWEQSKHRASTESTKSSRRSSHQHEVYRAPSTRLQDVSTGSYRSPNKARTGKGSGGIETAIGGLSMADPLSQMRKACVNEDSDNACESASTASNEPPVMIGLADSVGGILRNAANFSARSQTAADPVCTHRTLNAAGQPRKVVVPLGQQSSSTKSRESSPLRRKSPLRQSKSAYDHLSYG